MVEQRRGQWPEAGTAAVRPREEPMRAAVHERSDVSERREHTHTHVNKGKGDEQRSRDGGASSFERLLPAPDLFSKQCQQLRWRRKLWRRKLWQRQRQWQRQHERSRAACYIPHASFRSWYSPALSL